MFSFRKITVQGLDLLPTQRDLDPNPIRSQAKNTFPVVVPVAAGNALLHLDLKIKNIDIKRAMIDPTINMIVEILEIIEKVIEVEGIKEIKNNIEIVGIIEIKVIIEIIEEERGIKIIGTNKNNKFKNKHQRKCQCQHKFQCPTKQCFLDKEEEGKDRDRL